MAKIPATCRRRRGRSRSRRPGAAARLRPRARGVDAGSARNLALPSTTRRPSTMPSAPLPAGGSKPRPSRAQIPRAAAVRTTARASGCSLAARRSLQAATPVCVEARRRNDAVTCGLPSVSVPVLSTTSVSTFSMRSSASAFLISTPACAPRPTPTMIDIGVARPSAHGTGDDEHADRGDEAIGEARLAGRKSPRRRRRGARPRSPPGRTRRRPDRRGAGSARASAAPAATSCTICASSVSRPTFRRA